MKKKGKIGNGVLPLHLGPWGAYRSIDIYGGPYFVFPGKGWFGVCLREEVPPGSACDVHVPIEDFSIPEQSPAEVLEAIKQTLRAALFGDQVYAGCMGGWGRTGLFLALLAKATGVHAPITYVREHYSHKAVETNEQFRYVEDFDVSGMKPWLLRTALTTYWFSRFRR